MSSPGNDAGTAVRSTAATLRGSTRHAVGRLTLAALEAITPLLVSLLATMLVLLLAPLRLVAQEGPRSGPVVRLDLDAAIRRALDLNPDVAIARARAAEAAANLGIARAEARPQLNSLLLYTHTFASPGTFDISFPDTGAPPVGAPAGGAPPVDAPAAGRFQIAPGVPFQPGFPGAFNFFGFGPDDTWFAGLLLDQVLYAGGRLRARIRAAERNAEAARYALAETEAEIAAQVRQAYYDAVLADHLVAIARASLELAAEQAELATTRFREGEASELDVLRAEVERENLVPQLVEAEDRRDAARLELRRLTEIPPDAELVLTTDLCPTDGLPDPGTLLPGPDEADASIATRPAVLAARRRVLARLADLAAARGGYRPQVDLSGTLGWIATPDRPIPGPGEWDRSWSASISVRLPLYLGGRRRAETRLAQAHLAEAQQQLTLEYDDARTTYRQAYGELLRAADLALARSATVARAERIHALNRLRYEEGVAIQLEVLDALVTLQQARSNLIQAYHRYWSALTRAERAIGRPVAEMTPPTGACTPPA